MKQTTMKKTIGNRHSITLATSLLLFCAVGCANFFPPLDSSDGGSTVNTGDYAYVASAVGGASPIYTVTGFTVGTGTLTAITGATKQLLFPPSTIVVNPANTVLYVAGAGAIYGYSIGSDGTLTAIESVSGSQTLAVADVVSMVVSPDGQWLIALDANASFVTIDEYPITSTGTLNTLTQTQYSTTAGATILPENIAMAATGDYVAVAAGGAGDVLLSFDTSLGTLAQVNQVNVPSAQSADQAVTFDSAGDTLYVARSGVDGGVIPYAITNSGANLAAIPTTPYPVGNGPSSILIDKSGNYLYVGNKNDSTISGFSIGSAGVLTALSGSPFATGKNVGSLGFDNSGNYILSTAINGFPDLQLYSFDTTTAGKLDAGVSGSTGDPTEPAGAVAVALTHPNP